VLSWLINDFHMVFEFEFVPLHYLCDGSDVKVMAWIFQNFPDFIKSIPNNVFFCHLKYFTSVHEFIKEEQECPMIKPAANQPN